MPSRSNFYVSLYLKFLTTFLWQLSNSASWFNEHTWYNYNIHSFLETPLQKQLRLPLRKWDSSLDVKISFLPKCCSVYKKKNLICPYMEYCSHIWCGSSSNYLLDRVESGSTYQLSQANSKLDQPPLHCNSGSISLVQVLLWFLLPRAGCLHAPPTS